MKTSSLKKLLSLPNLLSFARLPLAAAFVLTDTKTARIIIVAVVALSDMADGYFARRVRTHDRKLGAVIDPITDKLFVLIAFIAFAVRRDISVGALMLVLIRDIFTTAAFITAKALHWKMEFRARLSGKAVTVMQLATLFALLFWRAALGPLVVATALLSVFALADYTRTAVRQRRTLAAAGAKP
jgi:cardiolipin synthase (CMP-forming)